MAVAGRQSSQHPRSPSPFAAMLGAFSGTAKPQTAGRSGRPVSSVSTLTHAVNNGTEDIGLFSSAEVAEAFAREGETVSALETPVVRTDCRPVDGTTGFGVW